MSSLFGLPYLAMIGILAVTVYFRFQGGRLFFIDPVYARGGDALNLMLITMALLMALVVALIAVDWASPRFPRVLVVALSVAAVSYIAPFALISVATQQSMEIPYGEVVEFAELKRLGAQLLAEGQYKDAASVHQRALAADPNDPELHHGLAQAYLGLDQLDAAQEEEQRALGLKPDHAEALVGLGDIALRRANPFEAVQHYEGALVRNGELTSAHLGLGRAWATQGIWSVAQAHLQEALTLDPASVEARLLLGDALLRQEEAEAAISAYIHVLKLKPDYAEAYYGISQAQWILGQFDLANENIQTALRLKPNYAEALLLQGKLYETLGRDNDAIVAYGQSIAAGQVLAEPYYRRAIVFMFRNQIDNASSDLEAATRIQPNFPEAHYWLGRVYLAQGDAEAALNRLKIAIEQRGGIYADGRFYQGMVEEQLGWRSAAIDSLQAALSQDSGAVWADEARAALARLGGL